MNVFEEIASARCVALEAHPSVRFPGSKTRRADMLDALIRHSSNDVGLAVRWITTAKTPDSVDMWEFIATCECALAVVDDGIDLIAEALKLGSLQTSGATKDWRGFFAAMCGVQPRKLPVWVSAVDREVIEDLDALRAESLDMPDVVAKIDARIRELMKRPTQRRETK